METNRNDQQLEKEQLSAEAEQKETAQPEPAPESPVEQAVEPEENKEAEKAAPKQKKKRGGLFKSNKFKRGGMATVMSVVFIAIVVVINILVGLLTERFPSLNWDLTADKLNTLSDQAIDIAKGIEQETTIYLIGEEEAYRKDRLYSSYGLEYSQVSNLAEKLREVNSKISVEFIDPDTNPGFISEYPEENLTSGTVLVKTEKRHKLLTASDLFTVRNNQSTYQTETYSKVDSALAGALEIVNLETMPVVTMATGHGELLTDDVLGSFEELLETQNFEVKSIDFLTEEIPEETQLLMIPTPSTDYAEEEIQKLREYIDDETHSGQRSLLVTCHASQGSLPRLQSFLEEWGIQVGEGVVAETDSSRVALRNAGYVLVDPSENLLNENTYNPLVSAASRPLSLLFEANGDVVMTESLWTTAASAYVATEDMTEADIATLETSQQSVACIAEKRPRVDGEEARRSLVVFGSSYVFTDTFMNTTAFGDKNYVSDLLGYCTGTDGSQVSVSTQQVPTNTLDVAASVSTVNLLGLGVFTVGLPLAILIAGLVIFLKRRHL
ncbi:Gldg family protein [Neglectibacter caecimuris]|uniref:Gldg family protein n=1 Tax=Neglectibacter caecimuris TaxID=3093658 RepID=UPI002AC8DD68|nr:Gldg family protein [Neglectibacter sp. M00184]